MHIPTNINCISAYEVFLAGGRPARTGWPGIPEKGFLRDTGPVIREVQLIQQALLSLPTLATGTTEAYHSVARNEQPG